VIYSKQKIFCNICGKDLYIEYTNLIGRECKVCSLKCLKEYKWRETLSILNKVYYEEKG
jgi:hypothetical protein